MILHKSLVIVAWYYSTAVWAIPYLVSLKGNESLEAFFSYDLLHPATEQVKALLTNSFSIGDFHGFSGNFSKSVVERIKKCPLVAEITPDFIVKAFDIEVQEDAPRHLSRLSSLKKLKTGKSTNYVYDNDATGKGVYAYVLDSGVELGHPEFEGRARFGKDFTNEGSGDKNGHGTHVAGIIGSKTYGAAKGVEMIEIKVLDTDGSGSLSTIISALEFAVNHRMRSGKHGVANLSLGAYRNAVLNRAVNAAVDTGLIVVVAAGNSNINACLTSPASAEKAITVGAIDDFNDSLASFTNWGECVDVFASGAYVKSLNALDYHNPETLSGTSMAAPAVCGLIANLLSEGVPANKVKSAVLQLSLKDQISRTSLFLRRGTPNRIAYNGIQEKERDWSSDSDSDSDEN
ncbi:subtilase-type proteinase [Scheffersomyces xylosifermentans]|uniref:subtilase-type proteinase n=1 Tax=Scheffersomyces xylosifermentans TaxID=1304137 RepID=UPI00315DDB2C